MSAWAFAFRSLTRQPARAVLGALGVAAVGALLFDMLLLSRGLLVSFRDLLDGSGFDVRVMSTESPFGGPSVEDATKAAAAIARLPQVEDVALLRYGSATAEQPERDLTPAKRRPGSAETKGATEDPLRLAFIGVRPGQRGPWSFLDRPEHRSPGPGRLPPLVVNDRLAQALHVAAGAEVALRAACTREPIAAPPRRFVVAAVVQFPFDAPGVLSAGTRMEEHRGACGLAERDQADVLLVASRSGSGPEAAVAAIRAARPDLHAFSNEDLVAWFERLGFSYFRQISTVLGTVTLLFGFLLIAVLLTVSVNQRFAELAALRALGFTRGRLVRDVVCQSVLLVGAGGLLALPLGLALAEWLDRILRTMPGIPASVHFFVFEPRALALHAGLLGTTALLAALYPALLVARLPIAATLRKEAIT